MQLIMTPPGMHQLPPLPYSYNALEPVISGKALRIHHNKHHKSYVDGLNKAEISLMESRKRNDYEYIKYWEKELAFNGSGHILHSIFWTVMCPVGFGGQPGQQTLYQINNYFGSFNAFKNQFIKATEKVEGSGWGILTWQPTWRRLEILQAEKHQNLTQWSGIPIMVCDVWVAQNHLAELQLEDEWPSTGKKQGEVEFAGQEWRWEQEVVNTANEDMRRVTVTILLGEQGSFSMIGFVGRTEKR